MCGYNTARIFFLFFLYRGFFYDERRLLLARELLGLRASLHFLIGALWASAFVEGADLYGPFRRRGCVKKESCYANAREWKNNSGERERGGNVGAFVLLPAV